MMGFSIVLVSITFFIAAICIFCGCIVGTLISTICLIVFNKLAKTGSILAKIFKIISIIVLVSCSLGVLIFLGIILLVSVAP